MAESKEILTAGEIEFDIKKILKIGSDAEERPSPKDGKEESNTQNSPDETDFIGEKPSLETDNSNSKLDSTKGQSKGALEKVNHAVPEDMVEVTILDKKKKKKKKGAGQEPKEIDQDGGEDPVFLSALEKEHIFPLKNKMKKALVTVFFCRLCNIHLNREAISLHIDEQMHFQRMKNPKKKLKNPQTSQEKPQAKHDREQGKKAESQGAPVSSSKSQQGKGSKLSIQDMDDKTSTDILHSTLEKEKIFPLKKKSVRFPRARYFCRLCDYHMDAVEDCKKHCRDSRHKRRNEVSKFETKLKSIPCPSTSHLAALDELVERIFTERGLSEGDLQYREDLTRSLQDKLTKDEQLKDVKLILYGSSLSTTGMKDSDVNIDLVVPQKVNQAKALTHAYKVIKSLEEYKDVQSNFLSVVPCVLFTDSERGLSCQLTIGSDLARETNKLLLMYTKCDPRFRKLALVFRYWARICKVDCQMEGTVPAYCFFLMTVYFLQQCSPPVLPVLHTYEEETKSQPKKAPAPKHLNMEQVSVQAEGWHSENTDSVGSLWLEMLEFYSLKFENSVNIICIRQHQVLSRVERKWNTKRLAIEDPFSPKRNAARSVKSFELFEYIWDCIRISYLYFGLPSNFSIFSDEEQKFVLAKSKKKVVQNNTENEKSGAGISSDMTDLGGGGSVLNESETRNTPDCGESVNRKSMDSVSEQVSCSICPEQSVTSGCDACSGKSSEESSKEDDRPAGSDKSVTENSISSTDLSQSGSIEEMAKGIVDSVLKHALSVFHSQYSQTQDDMAASSDKSGTNKCEKVNGGSNNVDPINTEISVEKMDKALEYIYTFSLDTLSDGKGPKVICVICEKEGHLKMNCPEDSLPELVPLPDMTKDHLRLLTEVLKQVPKDFAPSREETRERENIRWELELFIQELYPTARLELFGSSNNGFGFRHSDLDLCMTFDDLPVPENLDYVDCIEKVTKKLKTHRGLYNVFPITTAKVPIIKFKHRSSQLEGDISLYNLLALHNTRMINLYATMDSRVRVLGYAIKVFAKICEIGDASRGSLSSYAYILMLIYYLQQCKPPVLPVLQELHTEPDKPERVVEGWNAWHFDDTEALPRLWSHYGKNNASVGELWTGLFRFYTEEFKMDECVVCIRQHETLTKFEKLWNGKCIAIEDPFDLNHNLGGGLSRKMHQYIMKAFVHGRLLYCKPVDKIPTTFSSPADYFFDKTQLTSGSPPNDRGCRVCNKIGHIAKECPVVLNRKEREEKERERRAMEEKIAARKLEQEREFFNQQMRNSQQREYHHNQNSHQREYHHNQNSQQREYHHHQNSHQREYHHNQNSQQREYHHNQNSHQGNNLPRAYRRSNSESQEYAPHTRQSLQNPLLSHPQMQGYMSPQIHQRDNRPIPHNSPQPHLSQAYSRSMGGMKITGPPPQQLYRMPGHDPQLNMPSNQANRISQRNQDPRMHQSRNHGPSMQGQFPGYWQVLSPRQVSSQGLEQGRIVNPSNQLNFGVTVPNEYYRGGNIEQQRFGNSQYRGQLNRPSPRK
ncbi:terminal uridylyltransferase 4-like isoform X2 [Saccostrea echinata]|uniref:terminal uridylyltransferase 4-like isoform X2 n=1 Tax=Saccostrea echinata TaxID=191078 RepID=UPI002A7ED6D3|nr:terminal uridylyltransferase 4-like isoform X2 [Saccostrea echinata]